MGTTKNGLMADILFDKLKEEMEKDPSKFHKLKGLFVISIFRKGNPEKDWFLLFQGSEKAPIVSNTRPSVQEIGKNKALQAVVIEIEDKDLVNFAAGGVSGVQGFMSGRVRIAGDFLLAQELENIFVEAGGVEKTMEYIKNFRNASKL